MKIPIYVEYASDEEYKKDRQALIDAISDAWGEDCFLCKLSFNSFEDITIDHWYPQSWAKAQGWTYEEIWYIGNLRLAHKSCNAKKGDRVPIDDYTLPEKVIVPKKPRSEKRPDYCKTCEAGRLLLLNEICPDCGSEPQPKGSPRATQRSVKECDHSFYHCWMCWIGIIERQPTVNQLITGE